MGYSCPVCGTPQADGRHLANHLAFTALIHGDDHETWLAEHAPGWEEAGERELAARVVEGAAETAFPPDAEQGTDGGEETSARDHEHGGSDGHDHDERSDSKGHVDRHGRRPGPGAAVDRGASRSQEHDQDRDRRPSDVAIDTDVGAGADTESEDENDRDVAAVLAEARELTRRMRDGTDAARDGEENASGEAERAEREENTERSSGHDDRNDDRGG